MIGVFNKITTIISIIVLFKRQQQLVIIVSLRVQCHKTVTTFKLELCQYSKVLIQRGRKNAVVKYATMISPIYTTDNNKEFFCHLMTRRLGN